MQAPGFNALCRRGGSGCGECSKAQAQARIQPLRDLRLENSRGDRAVCYAVVRNGAAVEKKKEKQKQRQFQEASNEATAESVQTERLFAWQLE